VNIRIVGDKISCKQDAELASSFNFLTEALSGIKVLLEPGKLFICKDPDRVVLFLGLVFKPRDNDFVKYNHFCEEGPIERLIGMPRHVLVFKFLVRSHASAIDGLLGDLD
jgi:hypothetical protein